MNSKVPSWSILNQYLHVSIFAIPRIAKWGVCILLVFVLLGVFAWILSPKRALTIGHLTRIPTGSYRVKLNWKGTPVDGKGRFVNEEFPFYQNYLEILYWLPSYVVSMFRNILQSFPGILHNNDQFLYKNDILIWLGHASFYLNLDGVRILIDPLFYNFKINKRHTPCPINPNLFSMIDYILISHDHYDHCDKKSLKALLNNNPGATFLTGLHMENLLQSFSDKPLKILMADWYQQFPLDKGLEIHFVPSRHYCNRFGQKYNGRLWGGFMISYKANKTLQKTIYFGGDSGAAKYYIDLKDLFHPDLAILGIGAYSPKWFMHPNHNSPKGALKAFDETGANTMIPMHFGTYNLSNENMKDPLRILNQEKGNRQIIPLTAGEIHPL